MCPLSNPTARLQISQSLRATYLAHIGMALVEVASAVQQHLTELLGHACPAHEAQFRRDAWHAFKNQSPIWMERTVAAWGSCLHALPEAGTLPRDVDGLELQSREIMEYQVLSSRLVVAVKDKTVSEWDDLQVRIKFLEGSNTLDARDLLRPEVLLRLLVEQWPKADMGIDCWNLVSEVVGKTLAPAMKNAFQSANNTLIHQGVLPVIALKDRVKAAHTLTRLSTAGLRPEVADRAGDSTKEPGALNKGLHPARARLRAKDVLGQIKRLFASQIGNGLADQTAPACSPALQAALLPQTLASRYAMRGLLFQDGSPAGVVRVAQELQERSADLQQLAHTHREKATIEFVALMFQSILAEERIASSVRVWFARLQMPVLRMALEDTGFLTHSDHPARLLIDRMGACVMGFDSSAVQGTAMETEIRRMVQIIEQYPDSGTEVYQTVYQDFQKFLAKYLTGQNLNPQVLGLVQQIEQKETLAIQYTIEMRDMLKDMPVREEIRTFLFKVWAEVLAISALRKGIRHEDTQAFKDCAPQLVWAASAKPQRTDRTRVIQELPALLLRLRSGMTLVGMVIGEQERCIKTISATLADAFQSKTMGIPQHQIDALAQRLNQLEDLISDDAMGDLLLDPEGLEMMLGMETAVLHLITDGGTQPSATMLEWVAELQTGAWFTLDHHGQISQVQFVWRSERKQLHLFTSTVGKSHLIQTRRLAAYLEAGLLLPEEEETLTMRATRKALASIRPTRKDCSKVEAVKPVFRPCTPQ
ncbi:MAG: DUF1631 family protein [Rhodoferax sp.]|nr:DUF1631 family protein [Rhodoferax sp.]